MSLGGWGAVAKRLRLNDAELTQFTLQLRHLQQLVPYYEKGQNVTENQLIVALRFVRTLEHLRAKQPLLTYATTLNADKEGQQQGVKTVTGAGVDAQIAGNKCLAGCVAAE